MSKELHNFRQSYQKHRLSQVEVLDDPIDQFIAWFNDAKESDIVEPNAMTLATSGADGRVSARVVLLKEVGPKGFVFYTNYKSKKALEIEKNIFGALTFWWYTLERQVRIEGKLTKTSSADADEYFHSRPRGSQIGAWTSPQSEVIPNRDFLESRYNEIEKEYEGRDIPRPDHWGGYVLNPDKIEFWQGRPNRLHDRVEFLKQPNGTWKNQRLAP